MTLVIIALLLNICVAGFWGVQLVVRKLPATTAVYGTDTPARRILASVYLSIAILSAVALLWPTHTIAIATTLFPLQVIYKLLTVPIVGTIRHPVVLSNLIISLVLASAWYTITF